MAKRASFKPDATTTNTCYDEKEEPQNTWSEKARAKKRK